MTPVRLLPPEVQRRAEHRPTLAPAPHVRSGPGKRGELQPMRVDLQRSRGLLPSTGGHPCCKRQDTIAGAQQVVCARLARADGPQDAQGEMETGTDML